MVLHSFHSREAIHWDINLLQQYHLNIMEIRQQIDISYSVKTFCNGIRQSANLVTSEKQPRSRQICKITCKQAVAVFQATQNQNNENDEKFLKTFIQSCYEKQYFPIRKPHKTSQVNNTYQQADNVKCSQQIQQIKISYKFNNSLFIFPSAWFLNLKRKSKTIPRYFEERQSRRVWLWKTISNFQQKRSTLHFESLLKSQITVLLGSKVRSQVSAQSEQQFNKSITSEGTNQHESTTTKKFKSPAKFIEKLKLCKY
eukprot:TRINITY_DN13002_c0_g1_i1.p1 TRINITY_DN13002_c0_g1~~TRINITY_DN13002_c0_g1_i1.p1  ORF type:complete len:256 (-),score=-15.17 TRINITY_DN13002_c0_g1_i1:14-781(-)